MKLAYVGSVVPDTQDYQTPAFSRAGNMFQCELLRGLAVNGIRPDLCLSFLPMPSYPAVRRAWIAGTYVRLDNGLNAELLPFLNITPLKQVLLGAGAFWRLIKWGWRNRADQRLIYIYNLTVPPASFIMAAARVTRSRLVASVNDINEPGQTVPETIAWRADYAIQKALLPKFDALVIVNDTIARELAPAVPHVRMEGGIRPELFHTARRRPSLGHTFTMVAAGSLEKANGVQLLLDAARVMPEQDLRIVIAGDGPLANAVRAAADTDRRIEYRGQLRHEQVLELYTEADLLLNLRLTECVSTRYFFPSKLLEYLASGVPVLTTCTGHVEAELKPFVYLLREQTADGVAAVIRSIKAASVTDRDELGRAARQYVFENKAWPAQARRVADLLTQTANTRMR